MTNYHGDIPLGQRHAIHQWEYADAAARGAATGFVAGDVRKVALQLSDNTYWQLTAPVPPTWVAVGGTGGGGLTNPMTAPDDLIVGGASGAATRLAKGADGQVLTVDPTTHHLVWATPSGGSGALAVLGRQVVTGSAAASVTFSSIPGTYDALQLVYQGRSTAAVTREAQLLRFNGDTSALYFDVPLNAFGSTVSVGADALVTGAFAGDLNGTSVTAGMAGRGQIMIPAYASTTYDKGYVGTSSIRTGTTPADQLIRNFGGSWASAAAITSLTLYAASGNLAVGNVYTLYGLKAS